MVYKYVVAAFVIGAVWAQSDTENATEAIVTTSNPTTFQPPPERHDQILRDVYAMCEKNGASNTSENMQYVLSNLTSCVNGVTKTFNMSAFQQEIKEAKPLGKLDEVFKKYCEMRHDIVGCFNKLINSSKDCLSDHDHKQITIAHEMVENLVDFICYKEGDRIALFIAEDGQTCYQSTASELEQCMNNITELDHRFKLNYFSEFMEFDRQQCDNASELQKCVFNVLETCPTPTIANIFQSLYKTIRQATPCREFPDPNITDAASSLCATSAMLLIAASATLIF